MEKPLRIRDPVHGLICFESDIDRCAWRLLDTPEFQRLRRIKQLGVSELVFPGATHTRFAHSVGTFHVARELVKIIHDKLQEKNVLPDNWKELEEITILAALLHDIGHGPFSHAFDVAQRPFVEKANSPRIMENGAQK